MNKGKSPVKKILSVVCTVLTVLIVLLTVFIIANMIYCRAKNKPVSFFGTSFAIVQTNSMEPEIMTGDLIVFRACNIGDLKVGDNIVFIADENFRSDIQGKSIVHKVVRTENGIETRGVNNAADDEGFRDESELLGICTFNSAGWGKVFSFFGKYGIIFVIALIAVPFIVRQIIKIVKLSKNKEGEEVAADNAQDRKEMAPQEEMPDSDNVEGQDKEEQE